MMIVINHSIYVQIVLLNVHEKIFLNMIIEFNYPLLYHKNDRQNRHRKQNRKPQQYKSTETEIKEQYMKILVI